MKTFTDAELLDALETKKARFDCLSVDLDGEWNWYDSRNAPSHPGWTKASSLRDALQKLIETQQRQAKA